MEHPTVSPAVDTHTSEPSREADCVLECVGLDHVPLRKARPRRNTLLQRVASAEKSVQKAQCAVQERRRWLQQLQRSCEVLQGFARDELERLKECELQSVDQQPTPKSEPCQDPMTARQRTECEFDMYVVQEDSGVCASHASPTRTFEFEVATVDVEPAKEARVQETVSEGEAEYWEDAEEEVWREVHESDGWEDAEELLFQPTTLDFVDVEDEHVSSLVVHGVRLNDWLPW